MLDLDGRASENPFQFPPSPDSPMEPQPLAVSPRTVNQLLADATVNSLNSIGEMSWASSTTMCRYLLATVPFSWWSR